MEINLPVPKHQRCFECVDIIERISKLPDEILGKILSYLPTKEAVATSILSKRWEHLWALTSDLDFSDYLLHVYRNSSENDCMIKMRSFPKYVDRVIFYHAGSNIRKCNMSFYTKYFPSSAHAWICAMITCNVQELFLSYSDLQLSTYYQLPWSLFSCNTLGVLEIYGKFVIDLPAYVCFPCLKCLKVKGVLFVDNASAERLFSSCPVLEELTIKSGLEIMNISVSSLKRLCIHFWAIETNISTPCLEYLEMVHDEVDALFRYFVNFTSSLVQAQLEGVDIYLLKAISQVECLGLTETDRSLQSIIGDSALPIFKNLKTLKLGRVRYLSPNDWKMLTNLLESSPNLQVLVFPDGLVSDGIHHEELNYFNLQRPEPVAECLSMHLKTVEIYEFFGLQEELQLLEYFLECGKVLEKMIIHRYVVSKNPTLEKKVKEDKAMSELLSLRFSCSTRQLMRFRRSCSSSSCEVIFTN
ncbi:F-box protein At4g09920-like [Euphorbia lathyris]|uniref:F-box protein At4g09920-like n=1 Tax=Euphorbia lathyris TaxID=212925 RepID=UPI003313E969